MLKFNPNFSVIKVNSHTGPKPLSLMEKADAQEPTSNTTAKRGSQQLSQEDIAALTTGIGSLVGALLGQAADHFQKKTPTEEVKKTADEPMVDDVE
ncbi:hypothetical protein OSTOST_12648 [Ostertagia ostertagi]